MEEIKSSKGGKSDIKEKSKSLRSDAKLTQQTDQEKTSRVGWTLYYLMPVIVVLVASSLSYLSLYSRPDEKLKESGTSNRAKPVLLSAEHVAKHDGSDPSLPIYLVILGKVFNVNKGKKFYGPGSGYNVFVGRDSTPSFITGKFSRDEASDDVSGLSPEEMLGVKNWLDFYRKEYTYVGNMIGRYYDTEGNPTDDLKAARKKIKEGKMLKKAQEEQSKRYPGCNSQWSRDEGSTVWCSKDSAGVHRDWVGVPRQYFKPGKKEPTCVCVRTSGPAVETGEGDNGDLDNPNLREYKGCGKLDVSCKLKS